MSLSIEITKKGKLLHSITYLDVKIVDHEGKIIFQKSQIQTPLLLQPFANDDPTMNEKLMKAENGQYFHYINSIGLEYLATGLWSNNHYQGFIVLGPFLSSIPSNELISDLISAHKFPISERKQLQDYYQSLSIIGSNKSTYLGDLLVNICQHSYIEGKLVNTEVRKSAEKVEKVLYEEDKNLIEERYKEEKKLMRAIEKGDMEEIGKLSKEVKGMMDFSDRIPESPFRSAKNLLFVLNTICRISAEKGGLQPLVVHYVSEKFAILIERAPNLPYLKILAFDMINEYGGLVQKHSNKDFSMIVKKAVNYIHSNLEQTLTLKEIAASIHVHPSHLSRKFKQDTGKSIIDYVNQKRVEEAMLHLQTGTAAVTDIALIVGYNDLNYFTRVFKKVTGQTPSEYKKTEGRFSCFH
ncbi:helix-turn-helix transcriptional regulator [Bacillus sp. ISL-18]|uniref:AraC family transcriptional regulator n=1 Tax=Bacillus sp. ISL-18 TaxID=2819118 RepID=UPI001BE76F46|nr:AraC family transcriptional regulator [Bacillus sp. ISL-18]MBT2657661.1 helix-turn-helix transcriptional regulator [Bacillus sp. ISL-18]